MFEKVRFIFDGTPCEVKAACTVWSGGKSGDDFKGLPITIRREKSGHEAADGRRWCCPDWHHPDPAAEWAVRVIRTQLSRTVNPVWAGLRPFTSLLSGAGRAVFPTRHQPRRGKRKKKMGCPGRLSAAIGLPYYYRRGDLSWKFLPTLFLYSTCLRLLSTISSKGR